MASARPHRVRKLVGLVVLLGAALVALFVITNPGRIQEEVRQQLVAQLEKSLGRPVSAGAARGLFLPMPGVEVRDLSISGGAPGVAPLITAQTTRVTVRLWPLIRSLGKDVQVSAVTLDAPHITLTKLKNGTWSYEGLGGSGASAPSGGATAQVSIDDVALRHGEVRVVETGAPTIALGNFDLHATDIGPTEQMNVDIKASLVSNDQNLHVQLKGDMNAENLSGTAKLNGAPLGRLAALMPGGAGAAVTGGTLDADSRFTVKGKLWSADGTAKARDMLVQGQKADATAQFHAVADPKNPSEAVVDVKSAHVWGPALDLNATAHLATADMAGTFDVRGPRLDLGAVLGGGEGVGGSGAEAPAKTGNEEILPEATRQQLAAMNLAGSIRVDQVTNGPLKVSNFDARGALKNGELTLSKARGDLFGGQVVADGTGVALKDPNPSWNLKARIEKLDLHQAMSAFSPQAPLAGKLGATLNLKGRGNAWNALRETITGDGHLAFDDAALTSLNLDQHVLSTLNSGLRTVGQGALAANLGKVEQGTKLGGLASGIRIARGWVEFAEPVAFDTAAGHAVLSGRVSLAKQLDLKGNFKVPGKFLAQLTDGKLKPAGELTLPLGLGGTLEQPAVQVQPPADLARQLIGASGVEQKAQAAVKQQEDAAKKQAEQKANEAKDQLRRQARQRLNNVFRGK